MRIAVDGRHLAAGRGVARYTRALLDALVAAFPDEDWRILAPGRAQSGAAALTGRPRLDLLAGGADVVWVPAPAPLALSRDVPLVLTVHDLSWERRPRDFTPYERLWHRIARPRGLAERAARVIAVSEATRAELIEIWGLAPDRVVTIRSGPGMADGPVTAPPPERPYFLAVGALEPRKAPELLARAHARARSAGLAAELVFVGEGRLAGRIAGPGVRVAGRVDDAALRGLYAGALAVVHPALLEGFAFPPVEAAAHGTPAIVADLPVHAETVDGGAVRVPPGDEQALADAMLDLERDAELRERLAEAGARAISGLSWERAARETFEQLRLAAEGA
jgi:glycosyltransferase involved in cell wall biosynthesis